MNPGKNKVSEIKKTIGPNYLKIPNELRMRYVKIEVIIKDGKLFNDPDN